MYIVFLPNKICMGLQQLSSKLLYLLLGVNYFWAWRQLEQMFKSLSEAAFTSTYNWREMQK
ncbi:hypothetical protein Chro_5864 (plasmid) [Chroococcidiopsis thermalis PCC 7203]|uniref:Uncharacterized protein n=1 Tax=Chroococcidiopsis thermalis (strain PCC 7203) TaxID=251229 RepID=K9U7X8_CHRTP|nr:hypothetical protein Chro_5864 [Chroococcidiopsis thermalis PCC 7203]